MNRIREVRAQDLYGVVEPGVITVDFDKAVGEHGLMYRTALPDGHGMLFVYSTERRRIFWMHETKLPLDAGFIAANGRLNEIVAPPARWRPPSPLALMRLLVIQGGADQRTRPDAHGCREPFGPLEERGDALHFATDPLERDLEVIAFDWRGLLAASSRR